MYRCSLSKACPVLVSLAVALGFGLKTTPAAAAVLTVGSDGACTHSTIPSALLAAALAAGDDEIRISSNQSYLNQYIHLTNWDPSTIGALTIIGGFDSCVTAAAGARQTRGTGPLTTIEGQAGSPVFEIDTTAGSESVVTLSFLDLKSSGDRGLLVQGNSTVEVSDLFIRQNVGGVEAGPGTNVALRNSYIFQNTGAGQGGGVRCEGASLTLYNLAVFANAAVEGGGLFAAAGCSITATSAFVDLIENTAERGAGLYADTASSISPDLVRISRNVASESGGGAYVTGGAVVTLLNPVVAENEAVSQGAGLYATGGAVVALRGTVRSVCPALGLRDLCPELSRNELTSGVLGSAAYVTGGADVLLNRVFIEENMDSFGTGFALYATGSGSSLVMEGVQIWNNRTNALWYATDAALVRVAFISAARNSWNTPSTASKGALIASGADFQLYSSVLWDISAFDVAGAGSVTADCVIAETTAGISISFGSTLDPGFRDADGGDLHVMPSSPAVDYCDAGVYSPLYPDTDLETRGYDHSDNPNGSPGLTTGTYDLGFDEVVYFFWDGFESGDTSGWSSATP